VSYSSSPTNSQSIYEGMEKEKHGKKKKETKL
jgi:hypothetical protein